MSTINGINSAATASTELDNDWEFVEMDTSVNKIGVTPLLPDLRQPAPSLFKRVHEEQGSSNIKSFFLRLFRVETKETTSSQPKPRPTEEQKTKIADVENKFSKAIVIYSNRTGFPQKTLQQDLDKLISILKEELSQGREKIAITSLPLDIKQLFIVFESGQAKGTQAVVPDLFEGSLGAERQTVVLALNNRCLDLTQNSAATAQFQHKQVVHTRSTSPKAPALRAAYAHNIQFIPATSYEPPASRDSGYSKSSYEKEVDFSNPFAGLRRELYENGEMRVYDQNDNLVNVSKLLRQSADQSRTGSTRRYLGVDAADDTEHHTW